MSNRKKENEVLENVAIEKIAAEGKSIAHVGEKVLFVPQVIPGDIVNVRVTRKKRGYMEGIAIKIVTPSPDRIAPFCEHYGECGGCKWQPLPYSIQLATKQQQVLDQLQRIGKIDLSQVAVHPILGSQKTTEYRNKLEFTFSDRRWLQKGESPSEIFDAPISLDPSDFPGGIFPRHLRNGFSSVNTNPQGYGLGFHIQGCFDKVLDIHRCHLQKEPSNEIRNFIRQYAIEHHLAFFNLREQSGFLRNIVLRNNSAGDIMLILSVTSGPSRTFSAGGERALQTTGGERTLQTTGGERASQTAGSSQADAFRDLTDLLDAVADRFPSIKSLNYVINDKLNDSLGDLTVVNYMGEDAIYEEMEDIRFKIGPKSFYQTNSEQAYRLYSIVRDFADFKGSEKVYDLYTGTGTIALFIARRVQSVIGIEYVPEAIEDARVNSDVNNIDNCTFYAGDMKDLLTCDFVRDNGGTPDVIILDPPRAGIHPDVIKVLLEIKSPTIIYVSCNPATQARDVLALSTIYRVTDTAPVDMFPHTQHVENVLKLQLRQP